MVQELRDNILSLSTQSISETMLPATDLGLKIPIHSRASLLAGTITASLDADKFLITITLPEFLPVFTLYKIKVLPFNPSATGIYNILKLQRDTIAVNANHETFYYDESVCFTQKTVTICPTNLLTIKHRPTDCAEVIVTASSDLADICLIQVAMTKPQTQSFIYINEM
jgi:hypothetical protein